MAEHPTAPNRLRKLALGVLALLFGALMCTPASAHGYYRGKARVGVGVVIGGPVFGPWYGYPRPYYPRYYPRPYYYPPAYYPPPVVAYPPVAYPPVTYPPAAYPPVTYPPAVMTVPGSPPVYVEKGQPGAAQAPGPQAAQPATWYYCPTAKGYYPYVSQCPGGWQSVPAQPPPPPPPN